MEITQNVAVVLSRGFLQGSLLGCAFLAIGLIGWLLTVLIGVEKDTSLTGFSLTPLYVLSFGLGGSALALLRKDRPRWYESAFAWAGALAIVLLGCGVIIALLLESGQTIEWFWGVGSTIVLCLLLGASFIGMRRIAEQ